MFKKRHKLKPDVVETVEENPTVFVSPAEEANNVWGGYYARIRELDALWEAERQRQIDALPEAEPYIIRQDDKGWWRVAKKEVHTFGQSPGNVAHTQQIYMRGSYIPEAKQEDVNVCWKYKDYEPKFKFFNEAKTWAEETISIGQHRFDLNDYGDIVSTTHPEGLSALGPVYQASQDAQERATERAASYEQEAMF